MLKKILCVLLIIIIVSAGIFIGYRCIVNDEEIVIVCNGRKISKEMYIVYMIDEAYQLEISEYETYNDYIEAVKDSAETRIGIDTYYQIKCEEENVVLNEDEKHSARTKLFSRMIGFGIDYINATEEELFEYFDVGKDTFLKYYEQKALYEKYFNMAVYRSENMVDYRQIRRIPNLIDRLEAEKRYFEYQREQRVLESAITKIFDENRWEYAKNSVELVVLEYPKDEEGNVSSVVKKEYSKVADDVRNEMSNGEFYHKMDDMFPEYVNRVALVQVDNSSTLIDIYGEELVTLCVTGQENQLYKVVCDNAVVVMRIHKVYGREENKSRIELEIKTKEIANNVRKAVISEEYELKVVNSTIHDMLSVPNGKMWENISEMISLQSSQ